MADAVIETIERVFVAADEEEHETKAFDREVQQSSDHIVRALENKEIKKMKENIQTKLDSLTYEQLTSISQIIGI